MLRIVQWRFCPEQMLHSNASTSPHQHQFMNTSNGSCGLGASFPQQNRPGNVENRRDDRPKWRFPLFWKCCSKHCKPSPWHLHSSQDREISHPPCIVADFIRKRKMLNLSLRRSEPTFVVHNSLRKVCRHINPILVLRRSSPCASGLLHASLCLLGETATMCSRSE